MKEGSGSFFVFVALRLKDREEKLTRRSLKGSARRAGGGSFGKRKPADCLLASPSGRIQPEVGANMSFFFLAFLFLLDSSFWRN